MSIAHIAQGLGLKKMGGEYKGPCPCCGGNDRFHIKEGRNATMMVHCRYLCSYASIMRQLEDLGLVDKEPYEHIGPTADQVATMQGDKMVMAIYNADKQAGNKQSLADYRRHKLAVERHKAMAPQEYQTNYN